MRRQIAGHAGLTRMACLLPLLAFAGCGTYESYGAYGVHGPSAGGSSRVTIDGNAYDLTRLTEGTWTVTPAKPGAAAMQAGSRNRLIAAVESASGCKVTDSDYSQQGLQFDAQVECAAPAVK